MQVRSLLLAGTVASLALGTSYSPAHAANSAATQQAIQAQAQAIQAQAQRTLQAQGGPS